jgi:hypothetical protein
VTARTWKAERLSDMVIDLSLAPMRFVTEDRWVLLMSDEHVDNSHSDLELIRRHHDEARERGAPVLKFGDTFCAMQGKWDKRADQNQLRDELRGNHYLDRLKDFAEGVYAPYAADIAVIAPGNHETSISMRHQTNLTECLVDRMRRAGGRTLLGGFAGFVRLRLELAGARKSYHLCYHHGYGGGGEVTRGMIDNNRTRGQYLADIYYSGHIHRRNMDENEIIALSPEGQAVRKTQLFLRGGAYKREDGPGGWHVEKGRAARPCGGWWLRFTARKGAKTEWEVTPIPA